MFLIKKIFENDLTTIFKIEGQITNENLVAWANEIRPLTKPSDRQIILETCEVTFMCPKSVEILGEQISDNIYLLNCPTFVKNMLRSAGLSANVLD